MTGGYTRELVGATVSLLVSVYQRAADSTDGALVALQGISVTIKGPDGANVISVGSFVYRGVGQYTYLWNTTGLAPGSYKVEFSAIVSGGGTTVKKDARVELV